MKSTLSTRVALAAALAMAGGWAEAPASPGYSMPNGYAPSRGNSSHTKATKASKTAKNRRRAKAAAKSRREQRKR